jgi:hypothetical protein
VRIVSRTCTLIGTCTMTSTGSWTTYADFTAPLTPVTGAHDIYLVFQTDAGTTHVANLNWFRLN